MTDAISCKICTKRYVCRVLDLIYKTDGAFSCVYCEYPEHRQPKNANIVADTMRNLMPRVCPEFVRDMNEYSPKLKSMMAKSALAKIEKKKTTKQKKKTKVRK